MLFALVVPRFDCRSVVLVVRVVVVFRFAYSGCVDVNACHFERWGYSDSTARHCFLCRAAKWADVSRATRFRHFLSTFRRVRFNFELFRFSSRSQACLYPNVFRQVGVGDQFFVEVYYRWYFCRHDLFGDQGGHFCARLKFLVRFTCFSARQANSSLHARDPLAFRVVTT